MRSQNDIVRQLRDVLIDLDELKTAQFVGTNQIVAKPYESGNAYDKQFTITAPFQSPGYSFKAIKITVTPEDLADGNILLSNVIPELRYTNGVLVTNWDFANSWVNLDTFFFMVLIDSADQEKNTYMLGIVAPDATVMRLKVHITANAKTNFSILELN